MRQIFFTLVGINVLIFGWGLLFAGAPEGSGPSVSGAPSVAKSINQEGLGAQEARDKQRTRSDVDAFDPRSAKTIQSENATASQKLCEIVGPFSSADESNAFIERLKAIDVRSTRHELELSVGSNYWVFLSPLSSRKEAQGALKKLQSLGVDSYVVPKGDYANAISLGMFTKKNLADSVVKNLKDKKYSPELKIIDRTQMETWVMISPLDAEKMSDLTWNRVMKELNNQERRQNFCLDVASEQNIH